MTARSEDSQNIAEIEVSSSVHMVPGDPIINTSIDLTKVGPGKGDSDNAAINQNDRIENLDIVDSSAVSSLEGCSLDDRDYSNDCKDSSNLTKKMENRELTQMKYYFDCNICLETVKEPVVTRCGHLYCWPCLYKWLEPGITPSEKEQLNFLAPISSIANYENERRHRQQLNVPSSNDDTNVVRSNHDTIDYTRRTCPVCKASCCISTIVPLYVKSTHNSTERSHRSHSTNHHGNEREVSNEVILRRETPLRPIPSTTFFHSPRNDSRDDPVSFRVSSPPPLLTSATLSSSFDQSIVPVLLGLREMNSQSIPSYRVSQNQRLFTNTEGSTDEQLQYTLMEEVTTDFLSKILLTMGSVVILILLLF